MKQLCSVLPSEEFKAGISCQTS